jgi:hypothetical protein
MNEIKIFSLFNTPQYLKRELGWYSIVDTNKGIKDVWDLSNIKTGKEIDDCEEIIPDCCDIYI